MAYPHSSESDGFGLEPGLLDGVGEITGRQLTAWEHLGKPFVEAHPGVEYALILP